MQRIMKIGARGALGLGAAALLWAVVPAPANPVAGDAFRENQPRLLAQGKTRPGEAEKLPPPGVKQEDIEQNQPRDFAPPPEMGRMPEKNSSSKPMQEVKPAAPGSKRFGAGVIREKSENPVDEE